MKKPDPPLRDEVRTTPRAAATRCPYCHDDVQPAGSVACQDCLGRHHPACWDENGACASCGATQQMRAAPRLLDDTSVRRILVSHDYTDEEIDAYLRGEKAVQCHFAGCVELGTKDDIWRPKRKVCLAHNRRQWMNFLTVLGILFVLFSALALVL